MTYRRRATAHSAERGRLKVLWSMQMIDASWPTREVSG